MPIKTTQKKIPNLRFPMFEGEWEEKRLGEVANVLGGKRIPKGFSLQKEDNGHPYITVSDMENNSVSLENIKFVPDQVIEAIKRYTIYKKDIYISVAGTLGLVGIVPDELDGANLTENADKLTSLKCNQKFLFQILSGDVLRKLVKATKTENAQPKLAIYALKSLKLFLPENLEQQKIASFLSMADEWIGNLKAQKQKWEEYKKGMMQKIFPSGAGQVSEIRFKDEDGNDFPEWEEKRLGEVGRIVTGKTPSTADKTLWGGDVLFVTPTDILDDEKYQRRTARKVVISDPKKLLPRGSVFYTCIASIGKMSLSTAPSISNQQINALVANEKSSNEFVYYALLNETPHIKAIQANTTLPIINKTEFSRIKIQLPSFPEQQKIASFLTAVDEMIHSHQQRIVQAEEWKKGLMQRMFV